MTDKVRFLLQDGSVIDDATISASSATSGLPVSNVTHELIRRVYRTEGNKNEWILFEFAAATTIDYLFLGGHNLTKDAIIKWEGNSADSWASPALQVTLNSATDGQGATIGKSAYFWDTGQEYKYWRLYIEDSTNATTSLDIGRIMAGRAIEPTYNVRQGFSMRTVDPSRTQTVAGRQGYANKRDRYDVWTYTQGHMSSTAMDEIYGIYNTVGEHTAFVVALDPDTRPNHHTYYAQFEGDLNRTQRFGSNFDLEPITIAEKN